MPTNYVIWNVLLCHDQHLITNATRLYLRSWSNSCDTSLRKAGRRGLMEFVYE